MNFRRTYLNLAFIFVVSIILVLLLLNSCAKPSSEVAQVSDHNSTSSTYQSDLVTLVRAPNEPLKIEEIRQEDSGDLLIDARNISSKTIEFAVYALSPTDDCPKSDHPLSISIGYGDWKAIGMDSNPQMDPPVLRNQIISMPIPQKSYGDVLHYQRLAKCPDLAKPELTLYKVAFDDGTGWEGFADGPDHSDWNGRLWIPERK